MKIKYPKTHHLPWSETVTSDDKRLKDASCFYGKEIIVTTKMDGENTTMARNYIHARSLDSNDHPSRSWVKALHGTISQDIPPGWRICGENLFAKHSIGYNDLDSYFNVFSIWNDNNVCLDWDQTQQWCDLLGLNTVPVITHLKVYDEDVIKAIKIDCETCEGYVIRNAGRFPFAEFSQNVAKFVRENHVQTDEHWMHQAVVKNNLKTVLTSESQVVE